MIIYKITNLINGKIYIGQTNGNRISYFGGGKLLQLAFKKYGRNNFKKEIIVEGNFNQLLLDDLEIHYIRLHNSTNLKIGYNIESGGMGGRCKIFSKERKLKQSVSMKKRFSDPNERLKLSTKMKTYMTVERKAKISENLSKRVITEETRKKLSIAKNGFNSKGKVILYKNEIKIKEYLSLDKCSKEIKNSYNTEKKYIDTNIQYKQYKIFRIY